ncbi:MAG: SprT family zinc-dependent metalloprotease [Chloroflexota bacterium]
MKINKLIRSSRKTIALVVECDGTLTVRAPMHAAKQEIESFVLKNSGWIGRTRQRMISLLVRPKQFVEGESFLLLGSSSDLKLVPSQRPALKFENGFLLSRSAGERAKGIFIRWYKIRAFEIICERVGEYAKQHDFSPKQVKITSAKTRWGSCSPNGTLNFTWRLIMAPMEVVDYVVVHELAHLRVKNHSRKFWKLVESILPGYKLQRKWLRDHGHELTL